jgi:hypothetical protein
MIVSRRWSGISRTDISRSIMLFQPANNIFIQCRDQTHLRFS